jgi:hypothetical protein
VGFGSTITDNVVTYLTYLDVDNSDLSLRPGMTATASIIATHRKDVLLVPNTALRFTPTAAGRAFWSRSAGLMFTAEGLPALPKDKVYQLWTIKGAVATGAASTLTTRRQAKTPDATTITGWRRAQSSARLRAGRDLSVAPFIQTVPRSTCRSGRHNPMSPVATPDLPQVHASEPRDERHARLLTPTPRSRRHSKSAAETRRSSVLHGSSSIFRSLDYASARTALPRSSS